MSLLIAKFGTHGLVGATQDFREKVVTITTSLDIKIVDSDSRRVLLVISCLDPSDGIYIGTVAPIGLSRGLLVAGGNLPFVMDYATFGTACQQSWFGHSVAGSPLCGVLEVLVNNRVLSCNPPAEN